MLYWKDFANEIKCSTYNAPRYESSLSSKKKKIPKKVLRYFPLNSRLQRLFMASTTSSLMRCHEEGRTKDVVLRHPVDSYACKHFDCYHLTHKHACRSTKDTGQVLKNQNATQKLNNEEVQECATHVAHLRCNKLPTVRTLIRRLVESK